MATVTELEARLEALKVQRDSAVARVSYDGRSVEYRGTAEIARAIAELERELQALEGNAPVRQIRIYTSKGY
ncbi:MAG: phage head-tail joining protein [Geminicoccaceae bacterium]